MGAHLLDIGQQIEMRQRHALGVAFGPGGEQDHRRRLVCLTCSNQGWRVLPHGGRRLVQQRQIFAHIFEIDDLGRFAELGDQGLELAQLDKFVRRDDALDLGRAQRRAHARRAGREIEHGRDPAEGGQREKCNHGRGPGGQHHAHGLAGLGPAPQGAADRQGGAHQLVIAEDALVSVDNGRPLATIAGAGLHQRVKHRFVGAEDIERRAVLAGRGGDAGDGHGVPH